MWSDCAPWLKPSWGSLPRIFWGWNVSKIMNTSWTGFLSQQRKMWMVFRLLRQMNRSCCSCQILRISPHVKVCNITEMSIYNPRRNWHEQPKHFKKEYSAATVVDRTSYAHPFTFENYQTPTWHPSFDDRSTQLCQEHFHASFWRATHVISIRSTKKSMYSQRSSEWPILKLHWLWLDLSRQFVGRLTSPIVGEAPIETHLEKL